METKQEDSLCGVYIRRDSKTGFFSLTDLQEAYTRARVLNMWLDRRILEVLSYDKIHERLYWILVELCIIKIPLSVFQKDIKDSSIVHVLKKYDVYKTYGRGETRQVMVEPHIWLLICMELHPLFYSKALTTYMSNANEFIFVNYDFEEEEMRKLNCVNHINARKHFGLKEGDGLVMHHTNPLWRHIDKKRYIQWNPEDLQVMTQKEHMELHARLDKLILNRIEVGDYYIKLGEVLKTVPDVDYAIIGKQLNIAVFGRHEIGIRNTVGQEELEELRRLEDNLAFAIEQGYLKTMGDILKAISEYRKRKQNLLST